MAVLEEDAGWSAAGDRFEGVCRLLLFDSDFVFGELMFAEQLVAILRSSVTDPVDDQSFMGDIAGNNDDDEMDEEKESVCHVEGGGRRDASLENKRDKNWRVYST